MTTTYSQYDKDEEAFIQMAINLKEDYNINNKDLFDILWDNS